MYHRLVEVSNTNKAQQKNIFFIQFCLFVNQLENTPDIPNSPQEFRENY